VVVYLTVFERFTSGIFLFEEALIEIDDLLASTNSLAYFKCSFNFNFLFDALILLLLLISDDVVSAIKYSFLT